MKNIFKIIFNWLLTLIILGGLIYIFRDNLINFRNNLYPQFATCDTPITYRLNQFDKQFGISEKTFLSAINQAEQIWEQPTGMNLFQYSPTGTLKLNLIYDYRQDATLKLRELGIVVEENQTSYEKLRSQYLALEKYYVTGRASLDSLSAEITQLTALYNAEIERANRQGGASPKELQRLETQRQEINKLVAEFKNQQKIFNDKVDELNAVANTLNRLAKTLNISVSHYNTISVSRGSEFEEGTYVSSVGSQKINIYQFDDTAKLIRVLAHELGHALSLEHVSSTEAIMYYLNNGINAKLTPADIEELKRHCKIQ